MNKLTPQEEKEYENKTQEVTKKVSKAIELLEEAYNRFEYIQDDTGWDGTLISCNMQDGIIKLAFVLSGLVTWLDE